MRPSAALFSPKFLCKAEIELLQQSWEEKPEAQQVLRLHLPILPPGTDIERIVRQVEEKLETPQPRRL